MGAALAYHSLGRDRESRDALSKLRTHHEITSAYPLAMIHAWRGEPDDALRNLELALRHKDPHLATIRMDPVFASLQTDGRYRGFFAELAASPPASP